MKIKNFILFCLLLIVSNMHSQACASSVVPPATINGVNITATSTGTSTYATAFNSCGYVTPANSIWMGSSGAFTYTFYFSAPVNNVVIVVTATGQNVDEVFTFNTNTGSTTITDNGSCFSTIAGNVLSSGAGSGSGGGGGEFSISGSTPFTTLTITGPGGENGSLFSLCSNSIASCNIPDNNFIGNDTIICASSFVPFTKTSPVYASYSWEDLSGNVLATTPNYTFLDSGSYIIKTTGLPDECDGIDTFNIVFKSIPVSNFSADTICVGVATTFINASTVLLPTTIQTSAWDFGDGAMSSDVNPTHLYTAAGNYAVKLTSTTDVTANSSCFHDTTITVTVAEKPTAAFTVSNGCLNESPIFTEASTISSGTIATWDWNFGDVLPAVTQATTQLPNYTYSAAGSYPVRLIVTSVKGCKDTLTVPTIRYPIPELQFSATAACENDSVIFTNTSTIPNTSLISTSPDVIASWSWDFGDGSAESSQKVRNHKFPHQGFYTVKLIATSNNGCIQDSLIVVEVYSLPIAEFTATSVCENAKGTVFSNTSQAVSGSIVGANWNFGSGGATATIASPTFNYPAAGSYIVELAVETSYGCKDTVWHTVEVLQKPTANFITDLQEACAPLCTQFKDNSQSNAGSITDYQWSFGNAAGGSGSIVQHCFPNSSPTTNAFYDVTLIVKNDLGCADTLKKPSFITVWPMPLALFDLDPSETTIYDPVIQVNNLSEGGIAYNWSYGDGFTSTSFEESHIYGDTGTYQISLLVSTSHNCVDSISKLVRINPVLSVYAPNTFTPNGDGVNDSFIIKGYAINFDSFEFLIFDRWGKLIYETDGNNPWDGTYKGEVAPEDTYIYRITLKDLKGKMIEYMGHITLLK